MTTQILKSAFSKVLTTGVIVAACVGGAALPASAATTDASGPVSSTGAVTYKASLDFHVHDGVTLGAGEAVATDRVELTFTKDAENNTELDAAWDYWATNAAGVAEFPILQNGHETGFYIQPQLTTNHFTSSPGVRCDVYEGKPGNGGVVAPESTSPFNCDMSKHVFSNDWDFDVHPSGH